MKRNGFTFIELLIVICIVAIIAAIATPALLRNRVASEAAAVEKTTKEAYAQTGMPGITQFTERRLLRKLYELRDKEVSTYTYVRDYEGRLHHLCDSIGFGVPFSAQYSNPETFDGWHDSPIPQPEPNGLYPPTASSAP